MTNEGELAELCCKPLQHVHAATVNVQMRGVCKDSHVFLPCLLEHKSSEELDWVRIGVSPTVHEH